MKAVIFTVFVLCLSHLLGVSLAIPVHKRQDDLPPLISSRIQLPKSHPPADLHSEETAMKNNAKLPPGTKVIGGFALNSTSPPVNSTIAEKRGPKDYYYASSAEIEELVFSSTLSANSYCKSVIPGGNWTCGNCGGIVQNVTLVKTFTTLIFDTNAMIVRHDAGKVIYVVFRGSASVRNYITDLTFIAMPYPPAPLAGVHTGFYNGYVEVQRQLVPAVMAELTAYPDYKITVTGQSLGGAYAVLHALDLYQRDARLSPSNLEIVTHGQPRVGTPIFAYYAASTNLRHRRVVNKRDLVTHLPPQLFRFLHSGVEYWITDDGQYKVCDYIYETFYCSNSIVPFTNMDDHLSYPGFDGSCE